MQMSVGTMLHSQSLLIVQLPPMKIFFAAFFAPGRSGFVTTTINFSANTSSVRVSADIEARVEKRTKDTFAPPGGKKLVVLSNTSRRRGFALGKLPGLGFDPAMLTGFVCSGEEAHKHMAVHHRGRKALWISWAEDFQAWQPDYLEGTGVELAPAAEAVPSGHGTQGVAALPSSS